MEGCLKKGVRGEIQFIPGAFGIEGLCSPNPRLLVGGGLLNSGRVGGGLHRGWYRNGPVVLTHPSLHRLCRVDCSGEKHEDGKNEGKGPGKGGGSSS